MDDHPRWYRRLWGTLNEPPIVTALQVVVYALCVVGGVMAGTRPSPLAAANALASGLLIVGGAVALPAAWRGAWWIEAPAAGLTTAGFGVLVFLDLLARAELDMRFPGLVPILMAIVALNFAVRLVRIWPHMAPPDSGRDPITQDEARSARVVAESEQRIRDHDQ